MYRARTSSVFLVSFCVLIVSGFAQAANPTQAFWSDVAARPLSLAAPQARNFRALELDLAAMQQRLSSVRSGDAVELSLPRPGGGFVQVSLRDSRTLPLSLQQRYPQIVSLAGHDADGNPVRVDSSPRGFQAMVFDRQGTWVVRPERLGTDAGYMSFFKSDLPAPERLQTQPDLVSGALRAGYRPAAVPLTSTGETQREYRLAVAADGEYVASVGLGTQVGGLSAVTQAINRVNQVYETELGVHLTLIANEIAIIYTDAATDPYANTSDDIDTNQTSLDAVIGNANYDVGHVFTTGSGGVAGLGVTCVNSQKGRGTTGLPNPTGDAFYIDYVSHELGHEFGANHPFNSETGSCGGGNRSSSTAYEPGSGSTILAYAGICLDNDLQPHSNPYFHAISLHEIDTWIEGAGGACAAATTSGDAAPVIDAASLPASGLTLPMHTPFTLTATASDTDGDALSYTWEQMDLGDPTNLVQGDVGNGPIFRSRPAQSNGNQTFPAMTAVLGGVLDKGDAWPTSNRSLNFRLTVRDNHGVPAVTQYGRSTSIDAPTLTVTTGAGPFVVTQPNTAAVNWVPNTTQTVTWNVANTDQAPVGCTQVTLSLSTDAGNSFPAVLAAHVANDGSHEVTVPATQTSNARVQVHCDNNIFFDVSDANFTIAALPDKIFRNGFEATSIAQPVQDPGFEATAGDGTNPYWQGNDTHAPGASVFNSTIGAHGGNWVVWFGGWGTVAAYTQSVTQSVMLENVSPLYLNYWRKTLQLPSGTGDIVSVRIDGNEVSSIDISTLTLSGQYEPVAVDISAYANGANHTIELHYAHGSSGNDADQYIDDVTIGMTPITP